MKNFNENQLMHLAVHLALDIRRLAAGSVSHFDPHQFSEEVDTPTFVLSDHLDRNLRAEQLARIGTLAVTGSGASQIRQTTVQEVLGPGVQMNILWNGKNAKQKLVEMASPVVMAAMYDVLAAKLLLDSHSRQFAVPVRYVPTTEMIKFINKREVYRAFARAA